MGTGREVYVLAERLTSYPGMKQRNTFFWPIPNDLTQSYYISSETQLLSHISGLFLNNSIMPLIKIPVHTENSMDSIIEAN